jgi:translation initiation factor IF-1
MKEESIKIDGVVTELLPNAMFRVRLPNEKVVIGVISGRMRQNAIKILPRKKKKLKNKARKIELPRQQMNLR